MLCRMIASESNDHRAVAMRDTLNGVGKSVQQRHHIV